MRSLGRLAFVAVASLVVACSSSSDDGEGTATFTTYGEDYIEKEIPAEDFEDGWSAKFERFLFRLYQVHLWNEVFLAREPRAKPTPARSRTYSGVTPRSKSWTRSVLVMRVPRTRRK